MLKQLIHNSSTKKFYAFNVRKISFCLIIFFFIACNNCDSNAKKQKPMYPAMRGRIQADLDFAGIALRHNPKLKEDAFGISNNWFEAAYNVMEIGQSKGVVSDSEADMMRNNYRFFIEDFFNHASNGGSVLHLKDGGTITMVKGQTGGESVLVFKNGQGEIVDKLDVSFSWP